MEREIVQKLGGLLGEVLEVETDNEGECIGPYARVTVFIDITKPLQKIVFLELNDNDEVELPVLYKQLPDFFFIVELLGINLRSARPTMGNLKKNYLIEFT